MPAKIMLHKRRATLRKVARRGVSMPRRKSQGLKKLSKSASAAATTIDTKVAPGRKNLGPQRKARRKWVAKQKEAGRVQLSTWVPESKRDRIKKFIDRLKDGMRPSAAFAAAFPKSLNAVVKAHKRTAID
jgi:hypothetical protein